VIRLYKEKTAKYDRLESC